MAGLTPTDWEAAAVVLLATACAGPLAVELYRARRPRRDCTKLHSRRCARGWHTWRFLTQLGPTTHVQAGPHLVTLATHLEACARCNLRRRHTTTTPRRVRA